MKRVAGYILLAIAFVVTIPLQVGISIYGLVYAIRAFLGGDILTGIIAILIAAVCVVLAHFTCGLALRPLNDLSTSLLSKTDVETTHRDQREWERKQAEKGYSDRKRSLLDSEVQHIKESVGIPGDDLTRNRHKTG